jgi:hypothetical protein
MSMFYALRMLCDIFFLLFNAAVAQEGRGLPSVPVV